MNTVASSPSYPETLTLDERIRAAEAAVEARDARLRRDGAAFMQRLRLQGRRSKRVATLAAIGPFLLGWFMARSAPRSKVQRAEQRHVRPLAEAPWATLVPLLWPLVPERLRGRISPGLASFLTGIGLPLIAQRITKRRAMAQQRAEQREARTGAADGDARRRD